MSNNSDSSKLYDQHSEYRRCHLGGAVYLLVEGVLWLLCATVSALDEKQVAIVVLLAGGILIHPTTVALSRLLKLPKLTKSNRLPFLNTLIALTIPLGVPLIFMATASGQPNLFFPAFAVLVGAHWLPFVYIYAMNSFYWMTGSLVLAGILFGFVFTQSFSACAFVVGGILLFFAAIHLFIVRRESSRES